MRKTCLRAASAKAGSQARGGRPSSARSRLAASKSSFSGPEGSDERCRAKGGRSCALTEIAEAERTTHVPTRDQQSPSASRTKDQPRTCTALKLRMTWPPEVGRPKLSIGRKREKSSI